jgi:hypothetical protein
MLYCKNHKCPKKKKCIRYRPDLRDTEYFMDGVYDAKRDYCSEYTETMTTDSAKVIRGSRDAS